MTKVRTILAEFCSPKKIQIINQLGLLKKEERENQPVPWRHRLHGRERRELVLSEMKVSLKPPSRLKERDMDRAVSAARNSIDSKMGECLLKSQSYPDTDLGSRLGRLSIEEMRLSRSHKQARTNFIKQSKSINTEPLILVQRPSSDHTPTQHNPSPETPKLPGYMRPLRSRSKVPSNRPTIEAFLMETRKKRNIWDAVMDEKQQSRFRSATMPSLRLSGEEIYLLKVAHSNPKPRVRRVAMRKSEVRPEDQHREAHDEKISSVFITQLREKEPSRTDICPPSSGAATPNLNGIVATSPGDQRTVSTVAVDNAPSALTRQFGERKTERPTSQRKLLASLRKQ